MAKNTEKNTENKEDQKLLEEAHTRFELASEAEQDNRNLALEDIKFSIGDQWPEVIKASRQQDGRPCLVINKIPQFIQQLTNDQRQNRPAIKVHPVDDKADVETAKTIQGLIRHIEYNSNAEVAYDTAFEGAVKGGLGYFRIITDYVSPDSFEQEILIKAIKNRFSVFFDPYSKEPDGSDASWAIITEDLSKEEYLAKYPKSQLAQKGEWESVGNQSPSWLPSGSARVAEYFYKEYTEETICLLSDGRTFKKSEINEDKLASLGIEIVSERETAIPKVCWAKINGVEVLEKREWPGKYIPIIPVYGAETDVNGTRILSGVIRNAKDPARMYNYWASAETEAIALAPRAPFVVAEGQLEGYENEWSTANTKNHSYLTYKSVDAKGNPAAPPQRQSADVSTGAITQARMLASDDIKATTGIYDASLGGKSNETSGIAIQRRNNQAQTSNFHFVDNLTRALRHGGRVIVDILPKIYDTARSARIIGDDGEQRIVRVNDPENMVNGKPQLYALDVGKYDVTVDVGPSFQTKRQEAAASMLDLTKSMPQIMQIAGDLIVKNMDWPGASEIAERLKKTLPPNLIDDPKAQQNPIPPQVQQQMQQMDQMVKQLTDQVHKLQDEKETKMIELESRERIEFKKLEVQLEIKRAELDAKDSHALLSAEIDQINQRMNLLHLNAPFQFEEEQQEQIPQGFDGGQPAEQAPEQQDPTGGISPGQPMEGYEP